LVIPSDSQDGCAAVTKCLPALALLKIWLIDDSFFSKDSDSDWNFDSQALVDMLDTRREQLQSVSLSFDIVEPKFVNPAHLAFISELSESIPMEVFFCGKVFFKPSLSISSETHRLLGLQYDQTLILQS
jgi:hypothetical protein